MALQFDLSQIPAGAIIDSASLSLFRYDDPAPRVSARYTVYQLSKPWKSSEATWSNATASGPWLSAGGDFPANYIDTITFPDSSKNQWNLFDITAAAQSFVNNPSANYGIILFAPQHSGEGALWYSSDYMIDSLRPKVTITYSTGSTHVRIKTTIQPRALLNRGHAAFFSLNGRWATKSPEAFRTGIYIQGDIQEYSFVVRRGLLFRKVSP